MRMQDVAPSKPCYRVGSLYIHTNWLLSKCFSKKKKIKNKMMLKISQNDWKINLRHIQKVMRENNEKHYTNYVKFSYFNSHFAICLTLSSGSALFCDLFIGNSGGYPLGSILASSKHPWSDFLEYWKISGEFFLQMSKILEQHFDTS